jgi:hypothetical protein
MGDIEVNVLIMPHTRGGVRIDHKVNIHLGSDSTDTTSPAMSGSKYVALKSAANTSQAAFDSEMADSNAASWYAALGSTKQGNIREGYKLL